MRSILAAVIAALMVTLLALHPSPTAGQQREDEKQKRAEQEAAERAKATRATEKDYKSAIERLPDQKFDPWRNLR